MNTTAYRLSDTSFYISPPVLFTRHKIGMREDSSDARSTNVKTSTKVGAPSKERCTPNRVPRPTLHPLVFRLHSSRFSRMADGLWQRYERLKRLDDVQTAAMLYRRALALVPSDHPDTSYWLNNLGHCLLYHFSRSGKVESLQSSVSAFRGAVDSTLEGHPEFPRRLSNLSTSLKARYDRFGDPEDLKVALDADQCAVELTLEGDPDLPRRLNSLGASFWSCFRRFGEPHDLENALDADLRAVELTSGDDSELPRRLTSLAISLRARHELFGEVHDLESALDADHCAVELTPNDDYELPRRLTSLAISFRVRFERFGDPHDLESAIDADRRAVGLTYSNDPELPRQLGNLASSLWIRFDRFGELSDLECALNAHQRAVELTPIDYPELPLRLSNLSISLMTRFKLFGASQDLEGSLDAGRRAVELSPEGHPAKLQWMISLGDCLYDCFVYERTQHNFDAAVDCYMAAADQPMGHPRWRFKAAEAYLRILTDNPDFRSPTSLVLAYSRILDGLPELVWLGHSVQRRFEESARVGALVNAAVNACIKLNDLSRAVEWMEAGRNLVWSQVASMRTPLDELAESNPGLALALHQIHAEFQRLDLNSQSNTSAVHVARDQHHSVHLNSTADQYRRVAIRYDATMKVIRSCDGFRDFMRPKTLAGFISSHTFARLSGTVVFVNVARASCDALVLFSSGAVKVVELPGLTQKRAEKLHSVWTESVGLYRARRRGMALRESGLAHGFSNVHTFTLARLWTWIVRPVLEALDLMKMPCGKSPLPHVIWCPTGPLTQLPLHAAGLYDQKQAVLRVFDFVVSSYTPSLSALLRCLKDDRKHQESPSMLLVAQTNTQRPGLTPLPHVRDESDRLRALLHEHKHTILEDERATVQSTLAAINQHTWVHFACHGSQHSHDPTLSSIELYDKPLTLSNLMRTVFDNAELAFLSACDTAVGDQTVPEESAHFAAGMLAVGFKGVVATMWSICDMDGPVVVGAYYKKLLELRASGVIPRGQTGAAHALHHAVECLRKEIGENNFERWVPFVHFGV